MAKKPPFTTFYFPERSEDDKMVSIPGDLLERWVLLTADIGIAMFIIN